MSQYILDILPFIDFNCSSSQIFILCKFVKNPTNMLHKYFYTDFNTDTQMQLAVLYKTKKKQHCNNEDSVESK